MKQSLIIGVDVSKSTLDIFFKPADLHLKISNNPGGFKEWLRVFKKQATCEREVLVIMEHTGHYSYRFECFLRAQSIGYCKLSALQIKRSLGVVRGKNDRVDAERIAQYGWLRREILQADDYPVENIMHLRDVLRLRQKFVRDRSGYLNTVKEMTSTGKYKSSDPLVKMQQQLIEHLTRQIRILEKQIKEIIGSDQALQKTHELITSIKGIGLIVSAYMIGCTDNFKRFVSARKFNCYAGLAPFNNESGTIKGRSRVSHFANKEAKTLLSLAASTAIQHDQEMRNYYLRRTVQGKAKMSSLNIIRAKLVSRMFAVVKRQSPYQELYLAA